MSTKVIYTQKQWDALPLDWWRNDDIIIKTDFIIIDDKFNGLRVKNRHITLSGGEVITNANLAFCVTNKSRLLASAGRISAFNDSYVRGTASTQISAHNNATIRAFDKCRVNAYGNSTVKASGSSIVKAYDYSVIHAGKEMNDSVTVHIEDAKPTLHCINNTKVLKTPF